MGRIIAFDYGRKRTGIAVTDELQMVANALKTIPSGDVISFIKEYMTKEVVDIIVVGEPRRMNNKPSESVIYIDPFIKKLKKEFPEILIDRMDERFTSKLALRSMIDAGLKKKDRQNKEKIDAISATIILQSYLESKEKKST